MSRDPRGSFGQLLRQYGAMLYDPEANRYVSDAIFYSWRKLNRQIERARQHGFQPQARLLVHCLPALPSREN